MSAAEPSERRPSDRYRIREDDDGGPVLACLEAPTIAVRVERGRTFTAAAARSAEPGSIFLDGAAQGPPFVDSKRAVYNLDHHEGCVRAFTISTCEQALVLVRKVVDLRKRDWTVYANDADLDTVLAIWILLNHLRLNDDARLRARILPLIRLEGTIDVHGLGHLDLLCLPEDALRVARNWMDRLLASEKQLGDTADGQPLDLTRYVAERLREIDALIYPPSQIEDVPELEELARIPLTESSVAIAYQSELGIYEVAEQMRRYHGERLGMLVLQKDATQYSILQLDHALPFNLSDVYARLNLMDPAAGGSRSGNRWGGSEEIGGSPRAGGTRLSVAGIAQAIAYVFRPPSRARRLTRVALATVLSIAAMIAGLAGIAGAAVVELPEVPLAVQRLLWFAAALSLVCGAGLWLTARRTPVLYGLRLPSGGAWWALCPLALAGALAGGVWAPALDLLAVSGPLASALLLIAALALPAVAEILYRSLIHGIVAWAYPIQRGDGPWFTSLPVGVSCALYAPWCSLPLFAVPQPPAAWGLEAFLPYLPTAGGLLFGAAAGMARERSESVLAPMLFHWLGVSLVMLVAALR